MRYTNETLVNVVKSAIASDYLDNPKWNIVSFEIRTDNLFEEGNEFNESFFLEEMESIGLWDCELQKREDYWYTFRAIISDQYKPFFEINENVRSGKYQQYLMGIRVLLDNKEAPVTIMCSSNETAYKIVKDLEEFTGYIAPYKIEKCKLILSYKISSEKSN